KNVKYLMVEIDGDIYFFNSAGCMQKGIVVSHESNVFEFFAYDCGTDGKGKPYTGVAEGMYFYNGWQVRELSLINDNGTYIFVKSSNTVAKTCTVDLVGELTGLVFADNDVYYVENGSAVAKGLVRASDGSYYLINETMKAVKNCWYGMNETHINGYPMASGIYWFYEDGRMQVKEGLVIEKNGTVRYYEDGYPVVKWLVQDSEGNYYLINETKVAVKNCWYGMNETHLNGYPIAPGIYWFEADGKMQIKDGIYVEKSGTIRYYENGYPVAKGLVRDENCNYYYFDSTKNAVKNGTYTISEAQTNGLLPAGKYEFGADAKMINAPHIPAQAVKENVVDPTCTTTGSYDSVVYCSVCGIELSREAVTVDIVHAYEATVTAPTCTEAGYTTYICSICGDSYVADDVAALGHTMTVASVTAPTCTETGYTTYICSVCEYTYDADEVAALGHSEGEAVTENNVDPTCVATGSYDTVVYCSGCGIELSRETVTVEALGHSYDAVVTAPTCTEAGYTTYTCSACGDTYKADYTAALGHSWDDGVTVAPTCTETGLTTYTCTACGDTRTETIAALGHSYDAVVTAPTCTEAGYTTYTCSVCGDAYVADEVAALGHGEATETIEINAEPTCTESGAYDIVSRCVVCDAELSRETVTVNKLGHDLGDWTEKTAATCTDAGVMVRECSRCDYYLTKDTAALGHSEGEAVKENIVASTCTENGSYDSVVYCSVCDAELSRETVIVDMLDHSFGDWTVTVEPTYTTEGEESAVCSVCGATETRVVDKLVCTEHVWSDWSVTVEPTYTTEGEEQRSCAVCGATETQKIAVLVRPDPTVGDTKNYTVTLNDIADIKEIRYALGHYTTGSEVKAAEKNVTLDKSTVAKYTVDGVMTYDLPWVGEYTFWVRANDGSSYFIYTTVDEINPYVESYGVKLTVKDYGEDYKDMWLAKGTFNSYNEIKASTDFKYQASVNKMNVFAKTTHDFSYTMTDPGDYTVLIRYNDGSFDLIHHELTVDYPEFIGNGLQLTVTNIPDIKIIRTAYGHYESVAEIKAASGVRNFSNKNDIKNAESYKIQFREEGEVTLIVEYNNGYKHVYHYNVEKKVPAFTQNGNSVTIGDLDGLYIVRYAPGKYTSSTAIKDAAGSKYAKADSVNADGNIVINNLTAGTWTFCVQYDDESYNYYTINITEEDILPCTHTWGDWVVTQSPTYLSEGMEERLCTFCGEVE
ncbi:MAG: hypothetical protein IKU19_03895, partial [Clostridia bacterium]|nr:hypothetical protein [Clostridia bacterium]